MVVPIRNNNNFSHSHNCINIGIMSQISERLSITKVMPINNNHLTYSSHTIMAAQLLSSHPTPLPLPGRSRIRSASRRYRRPSLSPASQPSRFSSTLNTHLTMARILLAVTITTITGHCSSALAKRPRCSSRTATI